MEIHSNVWKYVVRIVCLGRKARPLEGHQANVWKSDRIVWKMCGSV